MKLNWGFLFFCVLALTNCTKKLNLQDKGCQAAPVYFTIDTNYYYIPNVFTPNGDGYNDVMFLYTNNPPQDFWIEIKKNSRVVYESTNPDWGWDGTFKGKLLKDGSYPFSLRITENGTERQVQSEITIISNLKKYHLNNCNSCELGTPEPEEICD